MRRAVLAVALLALAGSAAALDVPHLTGRVVDLARLLDDARLYALTFRVDRMRVRSVALLGNAQPA